MRILSNKRIREIVAREAANYLIALDALLKAHENDSLTLGQYTGAVSHLTDNTAEVAKLAGGLKGLDMLNEIIKAK